VAGQHVDPLGQRRTGLRARTDVTTAQNAAEAYVPAHGASPEPPPAEPTAQLLAALVDSAPPADEFPALNPAPPWVGWDHPGESLWPRPDDVDID